MLMLDTAKISRQRVFFLCGKKLTNNLFSIILINIKKQKFIFFKKITLQQPKNHRAMCHATHLADLLIIARSFS